jgi:hypothetical protein
VRILSIDAPRHAVPGQLVPITAVLSARGAVGTTTSITLETEGVRLGSTEHRWVYADERHEVRLPFVASRAGLHRVRIVAREPARAPVAADTDVTVRERRLRILAYEPRPSWTLTFVRRTLEEDPMFEVVAMSRTSPRTSTASGDPPALSSLEVNRFDVILVGAPEDLSDADLSAVERFASQRGGHVVVLPDRVPGERLRSRLRLPQMEEVLIDKPEPVTVPGGTVRASEFLIARADEAPAWETLARVRREGRERATVLASYHGEGRILWSGLLDAWRYRGAEASGFDRFWRSLAADAAADAPPRLHIEVTPGIARPGDPVRLTANWRRTEVENVGRELRPPDTTAWIGGADGSKRMIRLWPAPEPGRYEATFSAPARGLYTVHVGGSDVAADAVLRVEVDVVHPSRDHRRAEKLAADASGGQVVQTITELKAALARVETGTVTRATHPMRSPWWLLPFVGLLCAEWSWRRRKGLR